MAETEVEEIVGDREAAAVAAAEEEVVMEKNAATHEVEVEATAENATVVVVGEAIVAAIRGVVALSTIAMKLSARVIGVARDDLPAADKKKRACYNAGNFFLFFFYLRRKWYKF